MGEPFRIPGFDCEKRRGAAPVGILEFALGLATRQDTQLSSPAAPGESR